MSRAKPWQIKHIPDAMCRRASKLGRQRYAVGEALGVAFPSRTVEALMDLTGAPEKVCLGKLEQMVDRELMEYGVSLGTAWWIGGPNHPEHETSVGEWHAYSWMDCRGRAKEVLVLSEDTERLRIGDAFYTDTGDPCVVHSAARFDNGGHVHILSVRGVLESVRLMPDPHANYITVRIAEEARWNDRRRFYANQD